MSRVRRGTGLVAAWAVGVGLAGLASPAQAADAVDGALTAGDPIFPHQGSGGYDSLHYDVDMAVDVTPATAPATVATTTIRNATTVMTARTTGAPLRSFGMDLQGLQVSSVRVDGRRASVSRTDTTNPTDVSRDVHKLVITPQTPVDGTFSVVVAYSGTPVSHTDADGTSEGWNNTGDGATFVNQPVGAMTGFPHNDTPSDKATYTFGIDVPTTITNAAGAGSAAAVSNGELVSRTPSADGSRTTWVWDERQQMASELSLISIGKYDVLTSDVTLSGGRVVPEWSFVDSATSAADKDTINTRRALLPSVIQGLESVYGPYPGNSVGVVVDTVPESIDYALETQDRPFFPSAGSLTGSLTHELVHQWYGDAVAPAAWNDIWIDEGMATWGPTHYNNKIAATSANTTETAYYNSWNRSAATRYMVPSTDFEAAELYGFQTYTRGTQMWEALKGSIGDEACFRFVAAWQSRYTGQSHGRVDFENLAEEISGRDLTALFVDWLDDTDKPAWVQRYTPSVSTDVTTANPGDLVTYTLAATDVGKIPLTSSVARLDLSRVLDHAAIGALPEGLTLEGTTLPWAVPQTAVGSSAQVSFGVVVDSRASQTSLAATLTSATLGGVCGAGCTSAVEVPTQPGVATGAATPPSSPTSTAPATLPAAAGATGVAVRGRVRAGSKVRAISVDVAPGAAATYRWKVAGTVVKSSTSPTLRLRSRWVGRRVRLVVQVSGAGYRPVRLKTVAGRVKPD